MTAECCVDPHTAHGSDSNDVEIKKRRNFNNAGVFLISLVLGVV